MAEPRPLPKPFVPSPAKGAGRGGPARRYRWETFTEGNEAATTHGAFSDRRIDPRADELVAWAKTQRSADWLGDASYDPILRRWARREARSTLVYEALVDHQAGDDCDGTCKRCRRWVDLWQKLDRAAERSAATLGLDPTSRAELLLKLRQAGVLDLAEQAAARAAVSRLAEVLHEAAEAYEAELDEPTDPETVDAELVDDEAAGEGDAVLPMRVDV